LQSARWFQGFSTLGPVTNQTLAVGLSTAGFGSWRMVHNPGDGKRFQSGYSLGKFSAFALMTPSGSTMGVNTSLRSVTQPSKNFSRALGLSFSAFDLFISQSDNHQISGSTYQGRHCVSS